MAVFFNCSFARASIKSFSVDLYKKKKTYTLSEEDRRERLNKFREQFAFSAAEADANPSLATFTSATDNQTRFDRYCKRLHETLSRTWPGKAAQRERWLDEFSPVCWETLPRLDRLSHDLHDCYACAKKNSELHNAFPVKGSTSPHSDLTATAKNLSSKIKSYQQKNETSAKKMASSALAAITNAYQSRYKKDIRSEWARQPKSGLQLTPTRAEKKQARKQIDRENKEDIEKEMLNSDFREFYGSSSSQAAYNRRRLGHSMDTVEKAQERMKEREAGLSRSHVTLQYAKFNWDWKGLVAEAKGWEDGQVVNWSALARKYGIHETLNQDKLAANGGQIAQAVLRDAGVDVTCFNTGKHLQTGQSRCRRSFRRTRSGVAVPSKPTLKALQDKKHSMYENGMICRSIAIVPKQYEQVKFTEESSVLQVIRKTIHGQKAPLHELVRTVKNENREEDDENGEEENEEMEVDKTSMEDGAESNTKQDMVQDASSSGSSGYRGVKRTAGDEQCEQPKKKTRRRLPFTAGHQQQSYDVTVRDVDDEELTESLPTVRDVDDEELTESLPAHKSKHAKWLVYVLGDSPDVAKLDHLHASVKSGRTEKGAELKALAKKFKITLLSTLRQIQTDIMNGDQSKTKELKRRVTEKLLSAW